ncbi:MAG: PH domain-containing protein [Planctomycetota bacterium]|nr:PH domain-containing protein [Planctomycetota bacterium]
MFRNHPLWYVGNMLVIVLGLGLTLYLLFTGHNYGALTALALGVGGGVIAYGCWWLQCKACKLTVTNDRTTLRRGLLAKNLTEVWHQDVRNVQLDQTFLQRIFDVGRVGISSAGQAEIEISVNGIPDPDRVKELIDEHRRR